MIDIISNVSAKIAALGVPIVTLSRLSGISDTELRRIINRQMDCPSDKARRLDALIKVIEQFAADIAPTPINWKMAAAVQEAIERLQSGDLTIVTNASIGENVPRSLRTEEGFFVRRSANGAVAYSPMEKDAATTTWTLAHEIRKLLVAEGIKNVTIVMSPNRIRGYELKKFWQTQADLPFDDDAPGSGARYDG